MKNKTPFGPMCKVSRAREKYFWSQSIFKTTTLNMEDVIAENNWNLAQWSFKQPVSQNKYCFN